MGGQSILGNGPEWAKQEEAGLGDAVDPTVDQTEDGEGGRNTFRLTQHEQGSDCSHLGRLKPSLALSVIARGK